MSQNSSGLSIPVIISQGGTNAVDAPTALSNLGALPIAGGTMTGSLILAGDPTSNLEAATKQYADSISAGLTVKTACAASTTANLTATYNNGAAGVGATLTNTGALAAFATDGYSASLNDRILVQFQSTQANNGIYTVTTVGSGAVAWVLTRATDYDTAAEIKPGTLVIVNNGTLYSTSSWIETATVATVGTDPVIFSQFTSGVGANTALSNLIATAINQDLKPGTDLGPNLGSPTKRWDLLYAQEVRTGQTLGNQTVLAAYNTNTLAFVDFLSMTAGNPPTCALASAVTGTTQAALDSSSKLATTAYVDNAVTAASGSYANTALSNLSGVAINTSLISDTDLADNLGSGTKRWDNVFAENLCTGTVNLDVLNLAGYNTLSTTFTDFITVTAGNPPTCIISGSVTGVTQAALTNNTTLATTAYVDSATGGGSGANAALSNLSSVAINTALLPGVDNTIDLGSTSKRFRDLYPVRVKTDQTNTHTFSLSGYNSTGGTYTDFLTITANATATCALAGTVTGVTQATSDNSTKLATTAYADAQAATRANVALSNLSGVAINQSLLPASDNAIDLGDGTHRWRQIYLGTPLSLASGGTNANLTASNGGIFYSTATAGAILAGTATANQILMSGISSAPSWSTATYPATTTANRILYSSATNVVGQITTANSATLVTNSSGVPAMTASMTDGQVLIGSTGGTPTPATLTQGSGITITNSSGGITIAASGGSGALTLIASVTASSSSTVNFDNKLSATYDNYLVIYESVQPSSATNLLTMNFGTGSTPTYQLTNYQFSRGSGATSGSQTYIALGDQTATTITGNKAAGYVSILDTQSNTHVTSCGFQMTINNLGTLSTAANGQVVGAWTASAAITSVRFQFLSNLITTGTFKLYGYSN